jgi:hypothetical protein
MQTHKCPKSEGADDRHAVGNAENKEAMEKLQVGVD